MQVTPTVGGGSMTRRNSFHKSSVVTVFPMVSAIILGLAAVYLTLEAGTNLGFALDAASVWVMVAVVTTISLVASSVLARQKWDPESIARMRTPALVLTVVASFTIRLYIAMTASVYPDEFTTLMILARKPLQSIPQFLLEYQVYTGSYAGDPPLSYLLMSLGYSIIPSYLGPRLVSVFFSVAMIVVAYGIFTELRYNERSYLTVIFAFLPLTVVFFSLATTDVYMNFFGMLGYYLCLRAAKTGPRVASLAAGLLIALSFWSKASLGFFWMTLSFVTVVFIGQGRYLRRLETIAVIGIVAFCAYLPWYFLNPSAFASSLSPLRHVILSMLYRAT